MLLRTLLIAATAALVVAQSEYDALMSGAMFTGTDTTIPGQHGEAIYSDPRNHATAVASILVFSAGRAEFHPREKGIITDRGVYDRFIDQISKFPGMQTRYQKTYELELNGDIDQLRETIAQNYRSEEQNVDQIAKAMVDLIPCELQEDVEGQKWLINHIRIHSMPDRPVTLEIAAIELTLSRDGNTGEVKVDQQMARFRLSTLHADTKFLKDNARWVARRIPTITVDRFLDEMSTYGRRGDNDMALLEAWFNPEEACPSLIFGMHRNRLYTMAQWRLQQ